jgi:hypothetical protein
VNSGASREDQVRSHAPGVLRIPFRFPRFEVAVDQCSRRIYEAGFVLVEGLVDYGDETGQASRRKIVRLGESPIHQRIRRVVRSIGEHGWIQARAGVRDTGRNQAEWVRDGERDVVIIACAVVPDQTEVGSELKSMFALGPGQVVYKVVHRNVSKGGLVAQAGNIVDGAEMDEIL